MHGSVMLLRVSRPLLDRATSTLRQAVEVAYACGLLGHAPPTLRKEQDENAFAPVSVADPMGSWLQCGLGGDGDRERTRDRVRFGSHCPEETSVGASSVAVSVAHMEGVVQTVECGSVDADMILQLIIELEEGGERLPLAARWRPGCSESLQGLKDGTYVKYAKKRLVGKRVLVSGRLHMEERYDTRNKLLHKVPILVMPSVAFLEGSCLSILAD